MTDRHDPVDVQVDLPHDHLGTEHHCLERHGQIVLDHRVQAGELLIIAVRIHHRIGDQLVQLGTAPLTHRGSVTDDVPPTRVGSFRHTIRLAGSGLPPG